MKKILLLFLALLSYSFAQTKYKEEWRSTFVGQAPTRFGTEPSTPLTIQTQMDSISWAGYNNVIVSGGYNCLTAFKSDLAKKTFGVAQQPSPTYTNQDYLRNVIVEAHRNGLEVFFTLAQTASHASNDSTYESDYNIDLLKMKPDWVWRKMNGKLALNGNQGPTYFSAINHEMQEYMIGTVMEAFRKYDFDGYSINDDFISSPVSGGYEATTVALYKLEHNGSTPPEDYNNEDWIRWRANKINDFTRRFRDSIKAYNNNLMLNTSPCTYPWCYFALLQDSKTWIEQGLIEEYSPQFGFEDSNPLPRMRYEMEYILNNLVSSSKRYLFTPCIKTYGGLDPKIPMKTEYIDSVNNYQKQKDIKYGNYFFYYEHMRLNNQELLKKIKNVLYKEPAIPYFRKGNVWRPKAVLTNLSQPETILKGKWQKRNDIIGFHASPVYTAEDASNAGVGNSSIEYYFHVPYDANYEVYSYNCANWQNTYNATYTAYSSKDSINVIQKQYAPDGLHYPGEGWQKIGDVYLKKGVQRVLKLTNKGIGSNKIVVANTAMIMINRKLSPDVQVTNIQETIPLPVIPALVSPVSGASFESNPILVWKRSNESIKYQLLIASDSLFSKILYSDTTLVDTIKTISVNSSINKYFWKVRGINVSGVSNWSSTWSFIKKVALPLKPTLVSPTTNQTNVSKSFSLKWKTSLGAEKYLLQLCKDNLFNQQVVKDSTAIDTTKAISNLFEGSKYYWKVQAKNVAGPSLWSDVWSFTTAITKPTNLALQRSALKEVTLTWNDNSDSEDGYVIDCKLSTQTNYSVLDTLKGSGNKYIDTKVYQGLTYQYRIKAFTKFSESDYSNEASIVVVGIQNENSIPSEYSLSQNYPNPFNPTTTLRFGLPERTITRFSIFDLLGREVAKLVNEELDAGYHEINFDASKLTSGTYFFRIQAGNFTSAKKMILVK